MNKRVKLTVITILLFEIMAISCDPAYFKNNCHSYIKFTNNSNIDICIDRIFSFTDTTIYDINPLRHGQIIKARTNGRGIGLLSSCLESVFVDVPCEYISIFIFDANFMKQNLNDENFRINETMALQRYDLSIDNLNSLNWIIPYPPTEAMRYIKMYPSYNVKPY